ncbi:FecCD family ABC transporter permease [Bosea sp. BH3]|uniref:FecCD family ABC transporter permease n=1 Tax=Bosea sp. BH3 TaxID=2871701 RepID=UPI0021CB7B37|nr:iron ABC transporter permease [Bosea sp. BH3]MCU4178242.1 iron ABC transporter permease [Bosea sp. BH3]
MTRRLLAVAIGLLVLGCACLAALLLGARTLSLDDLLATMRGEQSEAAIIILQLRLPRLLVGLSVGAALGLAGAIIQLITRNPLGDPGLLGINAGASLAVLLAAACFEAVEPRLIIALAAAGAALAAVAVQALAGRQGGEAGPIRLVLAGVAVTAFCIGIGQAIALSDPDRLDLARNWRVGSLSGDGGTILPGILAAIGVGGVLALLLAPGLDLLALGEERATTLGAAIAPIRIGALLAVVLLAGGAVAAAGPIAFVGLAAPHIARRLGETAARTLLPLAALIGASLVLVADVIGRIAAPPAEIPVGIVAGVLGAPLLLLLARHRRNLA